MTVLNQAKLQSYNVYAAKNSFNNKTANISGASNAKNGKPITDQEQADISHIKTTMGRTLDTYTLSTRVMSYDEFYELMTSDKSLIEKHSALVEAYGKDVLSFCALEKDMQAIQSGRFSLEEMHVIMERRSESLRLNPRGKSQFSMIAPGPNDEDVARSIELSKKFVPIQNKMFAGKPLTGAEKQFLQEHYPEFYAKAIQIEQEVAQLKARLKTAKSKEEAARIYNETKLSLMSGGKNDKGILLMAPAIDEAYNNFRKDKNW